MKDTNYQNWLQRNNKIEYAYVIYRNRVCNLKSSHKDNSSPRKSEENMSKSDPAMLKYTITKDNSSKNVNVD